jgi:hypothetical protein
LSPQIDCIDSTEGFPIVGLWIGWVVSTIWTINHHVDAASPKWHSRRERVEVGTKATRPTPIGALNRAASSHKSIVQMVCAGETLFVRWFCSLWLWCCSFLGGFVFPGQNNYAFFVVVLPSGITSSQAMVGGTRHC